MKTVTVSLDDDTYRQARARAARADRSLSSLVREYLQSYVAEESEFDRLAGIEREARAKIKDFSASENLSRDELYDREHARDVRYGR